MTSDQRELSTRDLTYVPGVRHLQRSEHTPRSKRNTYVVDIKGMNVPPHLSINNVFGCTTLATYVLKIKGMERRTFIENSFDLFTEIFSLKVKNTEFSHYERRQLEFTDILRMQ